jgi:hypothetical protein
MASEDEAPGLGVPTFLRRPPPERIEPRVLDDVTPPLRFEADELDRDRLGHTVEELIWQCRHRRAAAWGGAAMAVEAEQAMLCLTEEPVEELGAFGVGGTAARAWLPASRRKADGEAREDHEGA